MMDLKLILTNIFEELFENIDPVNFVKNVVQSNDNKLSVGNKDYLLPEYKKIVVLGAGKASARMAYRLETIIGDRISYGLVAVPQNDTTILQKIKLLPGSHPFPAEDSIINGKKIFDAANSLDENDLAIVLISGGGSSLMELLPEEISLDEYVKLLKKLMLNGASIDEINCVRQNLSLIKGGKLAKALFPADVITLIISDVIGDKIEFIASGPTEKPSSFSAVDAENILVKYQIHKKEFDSIYDLLRKLHGSNIENVYFQKVNNVLLGNNFTALKSIETITWKLGINSSIISNTIQGEASQSGKELIKNIIELSKSKSKPHCFIWGGETTVTVKGNGTGGRCQEMILSMLLELKNFDREFILTFFGTDGKDGNSESAGAVVDNSTWGKIENLKLNPEDYLRRNDTNSLFEKIDCSLITGNTGTNVMDVGIMIIN